jgi:outer membrane protein TolC
VDRFLLFARLARGDAERGDEPLVGDAVLAGGEVAQAGQARAIVAEDKATVREQRGVVEALLAQREKLVDTLAKLEKDEIPKSTLIIEQTRKAFDLGQARLADLLLAERAHRDLLVEVLDTRFDLFNVRAQLRQALGLDDEIARLAGRSSR